MSDIVERLRAPFGWDKVLGQTIGPSSDDITEAADEIERLRAENERLRLDKIDAFRIIRAAGRSDKAETHVLAPREPTEAMKQAGASNLFGSASDNWNDEAAMIYTAMIEAAEGDE